MGVGSSTAPTWMPILIENAVVDNQLVDAPRKTLFSGQCEGHNWRSFHPTEAVEELLRRAKRGGMQFG